MSKAAKSKKAKTTKKRAAASAARGKTKTSAARKAAPKAKPARKTGRKKQQIVGEGDYQASRRFLKDQSDFVARHSAEIPAMGKAAEAALEGPEGGELRAAEEEARRHSAGK